MTNSRSNFTATSGFKGNSTACFHTRFDTALTFLARILKGAVGKTTNTFSDGRINFSQTLLIAASNFGSRISLETTLTIIILTVLRQTFLAGLNSTGDVATFDFPCVSQVASPVTLLAVEFDAKKGHY